ncbi:hypothetical protein BDZ97DRAFT_1752743 [Flammula alnicola]|nr:hypothetical protein BDZ97DRAFT_1752743 [Flammula alnicola]
MRNLDEIEVNSSPLASPVRESSTPLPNCGDEGLYQSSPYQSSSLSAFDIAPNTPASTAVSRKRAADEDFSQVIETISREKKFKADEKKLLSQFAGKSSGEQNIVLFSEFINLNRSLSRLAPPDMLYSIPKQLKSSIDVLVVETLLDPSIGGYLEVPIKIIENALATSRGFSPEIKENKSSWDTVKSHIRNRLTDFRFLIKCVLLDSVYEQADKKEGADALRSRLSIPKNISDTAQSMGSIHRGVRITVDIEFCGRVAFLRNALVNSTSAGPSAPTGADYWKKVDKTLAGVRDKNNNDAKKLGKFFYTVLEEDMNEFGRITIAP